MNLLFIVMYVVNIAIQTNYSNYLNVWINSDILFYEMMIEFIKTNHILYIPAHYIFIY